MILRRIFLILLVFSMMPSFLARGENAISVSGAWVRPNPPGISVTAAYMVIRNNGIKDDVLVGVKCECSDQAAVHATVNVPNSDSVKMREIPSLTIPAGKEVALEPGGHHLMLTQLRRDIRGDHVMLVLTFAKQGDVRVRATVSAGESKQKIHHHHH